MKFTGECCWNPYLRKKGKEAGLGRVRSKVIQPQWKPQLTLWRVLEIGLPFSVVLSCVRGLGLYLCENELLGVDCPGRVQSFG